MLSRETLIESGAGLALAVISFVLSAIFCGLMRRWAAQLGLIDVPSGHKGHKQPTPLGGGVAIWLATMLVIATGASVTVWGRAFLPQELSKHVSGLIDRRGEMALILGLSTLIMLMGLLDDRFTLNWRPRLLIQVALASCLVAYGIRATLFWPFNVPLVGGVVSVLWVVGLTNAFNMLDNMDGLSASVGLIASLLFAGAQIAVGSLFAPAVLLVLVGALGGFLVHNRYPARIFMGDSGSNFLGFMLGALTLAGTYYRYDRGTTSFSVLAPLLVMAVPLYDSTSVVFIRLREGRSPFLGDRRHFSHRLVERGLTPPQAVRTIDLVTLAGGLGALLLHQLNLLGAALVLTQSCCLLGVVAILEASGPRSQGSNLDHASEKPKDLGPADQPSGLERASREPG